jgi:hypothetical protein
MEHRVRSQPFDRLRAGIQNPECRRKAIKIGFLLATDNRLLDSLIK